MKRFPKLTEQLLALLCVGLFAVACESVAPAPGMVPLRPLRPDSLENNGWDRDCDLLHVDVALRVDLEAKSIEGVATNVIRGLRPEARQIQLHAVGLEIASIADSQGRELEWSLAEPLLSIHLAEPLRRGQTEQIELHYSAHPKKGLYFRDTSKDAGGPAPQVWSQGQSEDNRYWIPTWDYPNDRATFSGHFRVDDSCTALSNGALELTEDHADGTTTYHWRLEQNIPTYLIALAVGRFERYADDWNGLPVEYWVGPGTGEEKARRAFGETPAMLDYFTQLLGVPYPYPKYAQVAVSEFVAGGMENASLTIEHDYIVVSAEEQPLLDGQTRLLVAHELAHQWFGDLVTCFGWSHLWLNEAWASYMELLFEREVAGQASFELWLERYRADYLSRGARTRRPLSEDWRSQLTSGRCSHEYEKGPWVLFMLEQELGSEVFWIAVRAYLERHADGLVQTSDFARAIFDSSGRNVESFLEQWVAGGGHPVFEVQLDEEPDALGTQLVVNVRQVQELSELVPLFDVTVYVEVYDDRGRTRSPLHITEEEQEFRLPLLGQLQDFVFDAPCHVLCELELEKPLEMWLHQARLASAALRWRSLQELYQRMNEPDGRALAALRATAKGDVEVVLRRHALSYLSGGAHQGFLLECLRQESDPLARVEILELLAGRNLSASQVAELEQLFASAKTKRSEKALDKLRARLAAEQKTPR